MSAGEFVPPLWMINEYIRLARRVSLLSDLASKDPLYGPRALCWRSEQRTRSDEQ